MENKSVGEKVFLYVVIIFGSLTGIFLLVWLFLYIFPLLSEEGLTATIIALYGGVPEAIAIYLFSNIYFILFVVFAVITLIIRAIYWLRTKKTVSDINQ